MSIESVLGRPGFRIACRKILETRGHLVYAWMREDKVLYVGMSGTGLLRPISATHEVCWAFAPGDELLLWPAKNRAEAAKMEALAIRLLGPAYNSKGSGSFGTPEPRPEKPEDPFVDDEEPQRDQPLAPPVAPAARNLHLFADPAA